MKKIIVIFFYISYITIFSLIINIPEDQPTIQAGINTSIDGDTVLVEPGTYFENIDFIGKNITVASLFLTTGDCDYISQTIINGNWNGSVVTFFNGEDTTATLTGFTITNGLADYIWGYHFGGGIFCAFADPTISNNIIRGNDAFPGGRGGGIYLGGANPIISNVTIEQNYSSECSGGIHISANSNPILTDVIIRDNYAIWGAGVYCYDNSHPQFQRVVINSNRAFDQGGGILCNYNCNPVMTNVTITQNEAPSGSGIFCAGSHITLLNSILWNNYYQEIYLSGGIVTSTYSDIEGGWQGTGNIDEDPLFADMQFHLSENSPCIDTGDPNSPFDPDGTIADMGAYYFHHTPPNSPENVLISIESNIIYLEWDEFPGAIFYKIYRSTNPDFELEGNLHDTATSPNWQEDIPEGNKYFYKITAVY